MILAEWRVSKILSEGCLGFIDIVSWVSGGGWYSVGLSLIFTYHSFV